MSSGGCIHIQTILKLKLNETSFEEYIGRKENRKYHVAMPTHCVFTPVKWIKMISRWIEKIKSQFLQRTMPEELSKFTISCLTVINVCPPQKTLHLKGAFLVSSLLFWNETASIPEKCGSLPKWNSLSFCNMQSRALETCRRHDVSTS